MSATKLAAIAITCLSMITPIEAGVTWLASDDGTDLTLTTDGGTLNILGTIHREELQHRSPSLKHDPDFNWGVMWHTSGGLYALVSDYFYLSRFEKIGAGTPSENTPWIAGSPGAEVTGDTFGHAWTGLMWSEDSDVIPGILIQPLTTMVFRGLTVDTAFGTNLDDGPVLLWTHDTSGDTISVARRPKLHTPPTVNPVPPTPVKKPARATRT